VDGLPSVVNDALREELAAIDALPPYLTYKETWTFLRICERSLYNAFDRGDLERRHIGGRAVVPSASIRTLVLRQAGVDTDNGRSSAAATPDDAGNRIGPNTTPNRKDGPT
jgi:hypothetical protein